MTILVYTGFRSMLADERTAQDYLTEIRTGGANRRWPAAYELSRLMADPKVRADRSLAPALVAAFDEAKDDEPPVRRYLALAIGRLDPPLPAEAVSSLTRALDDPDSEARITAIWALGSSGDPAVTQTLLPLFETQDAGIRKMVVYALGALPGDAQLPTLRTALQDQEPDVRWNAAVALARHASRDGVPVLGQMLDRDHVQQAVKRDVAQNEDVDPVADVMISGIRAAAVLREASLRAPIEGLSRSDKSMKVRQAAIEALKEMGSGSAS
ncbi:MAG: HEAT repeat domain-containing protein [Vicinamibacterales bacterium]